MRKTGLDFRQWAAKVKFSLHQIQAPSFYKAPNKIVLQWVLANQSYSTQKQAKTTWCNAKTTETSSDFFTDSSRDVQVWLLSSRVSERPKACFPLDDVWHVMCHLSCHVSVIANTLIISAGQHILQKVWWMRLSRCKKGMWRHLIKVWTGDKHLRRGHVH